MYFDGFNFRWAQFEDPLLSAPPCPADDALQVHGVQLRFALGAVHGGGED